MKQQRDILPLNYAVEAHLENAPLSYHWFNLLRIIRSYVRFFEAIDNESSISKHFWVGKLVGFPSFLKGKIQTIIFHVNLHHWSICWHSAHCYSLNIWSFPHLHSPAILTTESLSGHWFWAHPQAEKFYKKKYFNSFIRKPWQEWPLLRHFQWQRDTKERSAVAASQIDLEGHKGSSIEGGKHLHDKK